MKKFTFFVLLVNDKFISRSFINSSSIAGVIRHIQNDPAFDVFKLSDIEKIYKTTKIPSSHCCIVEVPHGLSN